jgi:hypothetical protein
MANLAFTELIRLGSKAAVETNPARLSKLAVASGILSAAISLGDNSGSRRLVTLARNIASSSIEGE